MSGMAAMRANAVSVSASRPREGSEKYDCSDRSACTRLCTNSFVSTASCHIRRWVMKWFSSAPIATEMMAIDTSATTANQRLRLNRTRLAAWAEEGIRGAGSVSVLNASPCKFRDARATMPTGGVTRGVPVCAARASASKNGSVRGICPSNGGANPPPTGVSAADWVNTLVVSSASCSDAMRHVACVNRTCKST